MAMQMRTLTRMQVHRKPMHAANKGEKVSDVMRAMPDDMNDGNGPLHVILNVQPEEDSPLQRIDNATILGKVRAPRHHPGETPTLFRVLFSRSGSIFLAMVQDLEGCAWVSEAIGRFGQVLVHV